MYYPLKRNTDELSIEEVFDELMVFDRKRLKVHALNPTAVFVWQHCDGQHSKEDLTELVVQQFNLEPAQAEAVVELSLDRLARSFLLEGKANQAKTGLHRREVLKTLGLTAALLPVIKSLVAPPYVVAQSNLVRCGPNSTITECIQTRAQPNDCCCCVIPSGGGQGGISCRNANGCTGGGGSFCMEIGQTPADCP